MTTFKVDVTRTVTSVAKEVEVEVDKDELIKAQKEGEEVVSLEELAELIAEELVEEDPESFEWDEEDEIFEATKTEEVS